MTGSPGRSKWQRVGWKYGKPVFRPSNRMVTLDEAGRVLRDIMADNCRAIRDGQEVYCPSCALRWSLSEDRPECPRD